MLLSISRSNAGPFSFTLVARTPSVRGVNGWMRFIIRQHQAALRRSEELQATHLICLHR